MIDATTLLFGLPGVRVERVERRVDGTRVVHVVTDESTAAACPSCGVVSTSVKERVTTSPKDIPYGEDPIVVRWTKVSPARVMGPPFCHEYGTGFLRSRAVR
jgi:transposase